MKKNDQAVQAVLSIEHLSVSFTQYERGFKKTVLPAIEDLSITVHERELVAVVGSSGSGKSLLAHTVMGILPYNASWTGRLSYEGMELSPEKIKKLRGSEIVLVPQSVSYLDPLMKTGAQIRKGKKDGETKKKCLGVLKRYGLEPETEGLYPFELSGGMTRRILISTAVMESPKLVIADEPTPGLHLEAAKRVLSHFKEIADGGAAVLLITHDLELAMECADRIVVFYAGTNVEEAAASDFKDEKKLRHPYSKALYYAMPEHGFSFVKGVQPYAKDRPIGCPYEPRCRFRDERCLGKVEYRSFQEGMVRCAKAGELNP